MWICFVCFVFQLWESTLAEIIWGLSDSLRMAASQLVKVISLFGMVYPRTNKKSLNEGCCWMAILTSELPVRSSEHAVRSLSRLHILCCPSLLFSYFPLLLCKSEDTWTSHILNTLLVAYNYPLCTRWFSLAWEEPGVSLDHERLDKSRYIRKVRSWLDDAGDSSLQWCSKGMLSWRIDYGDPKLSSSCYPKGSLKILPLSGNILF